MTADNAELYAWPIDLEQGRITLTAGELVTMNVAVCSITVVPSKCCFDVSALM